MYSIIYIESLFIHIDELEDFFGLDKKLLIPICYFR